MANSGLGEKYMNDHSNPIVKKVEVFGLKKHLTLLNEEEEERKERCLEEIEKSLKYDRVDRRVVRSIAVWIPEENLAKVTKITAASASFGFQNKNGKFLNPEEALYLLEINKLELFHKNVPMSIEEAFKNVGNLEKYQAFKHLLLQGYKVKSANVIQKAKKESIEEEKSYEPPKKMPKIVIEKEENSMKDIFEKLRENGPKSFELKEDFHQEVDYNVSEKAEPFNLIVERNKEFSSKLDNKYSNVYAIASDNVSFYTFYNTNIPIL